MSSPSRLDAIVAQSSSLRQLVNRAEAQGQIDALVRASISPALESHVVFAVSRDESIVILADSSAWAAKMRFQVANLLENFRQVPQLAHVKNIRIKVAPTEGRALAETPNLSSSNKAEAGLRPFKELADIEDRSVRAALDKLFRSSDGKTG